MSSEGLVDQIRQTPFVPVVRADATTLLMKLPAVASVMLPPLVIALASVRLPALVCKVTEPVLVTPAVPSPTVRARPLFRLKSPPAEARSTPMLLVLASVTAPALDKIRLSAETAEPVAWVRSPEVVVIVTVDPWTDPICNACVFLIVTGRPKAFAAIVPPKLLLAPKLSAPRPATLDVALASLCCTVNNKLLLKVSASSALMPVATAVP